METDDAESWSWPPTDVELASSDALIHISNKLKTKLLEEHPGLDPSPMELFQWASVCEGALADVWLGLPNNPTIQVEYKPSYLSLLAAFSSGYSFASIPLSCAFEVSSLQLPSYPGLGCISAPPFGF